MSDLLIKRVHIAQEVGMPTHWQVLLKKTPHNRCDEVVAMFRSDDDLHDFMYASEGNGQRLLTDDELLGYYTREITL